MIVNRAMKADGLVGLEKKKKTRKRKEKGRTKKMSTS